MGGLRAQRQNPLSYEVAFWQRASTPVYIGLMVLLAVSMVLFGVVRATGAVLPPLVILALALLGIRFPVALALIDEWQADAIWWSFPISSIIAAVLAIAYYKWGGWRTARMGGTMAPAAVPASVD